MNGWTTSTHTIKNTPIRQFYPLPYPHTGEITEIIKYEKNDIGGTDDPEAGKNNNINI